MLATMRILCERPGKKFQVGIMFHAERGFEERPWMGILLFREQQNVLTRDKRRKMDIKDTK